jgi:hypothetical protein
MIQGEHFNLIHMPKTGGTWLRRVAEMLPPGLIKNIHPGHQPFSELSEEDAKKPTFIFVRNPWDWYVSVYGHRHGNVVNRRHEFSKPYGSLDRFYRTLYDQYKGGFADSLLSRVWWEGEPAPLTMYDRLVRLTNRENYPGVKLLIYERGVASGLLHVLEKTTPDGLPPGVREKVLSHPRENTSQRGQYRAYYTIESQQIVKDREWQLISSIGYDF